MSTYDLSKADDDQSNLTVGLGGKERVIKMLIAVARAAYFALDDSEEAEGEDGRVHVVPADSFDALSDAIDALDELPEPIGLAMTDHAKAEHALTPNVDFSRGGAPKGEATKTDIPPSAGK